MKRKALTSNGKGRMAYALQMLGERRLPYIAAILFLVLALAAMAGAQTDSTKVDTIVVTDTVIVEIEEDEDDCDCVGTILTIILVITGFLTLLVIVITFYYGLKHLEIQNELKLAQEARKTAETSFKEYDTKFDEIEKRIIGIEKIAQKSAVEAKKSANEAKALVFFVMGYDKLEGKNYLEAIGFFSNSLQCKELFKANYGIGLSYLNYAIAMLRNPILDKIFQIEINNAIELFKKEIVHIDKYNSVDGYANVIKKQCHFYIGVCYLYLEKIDDAKKAFIVANGIMNGVENEFIDKEEFRKWLRENQSKPIQKEFREFFKNEIGRVHFINELGFFVRTKKTRKYYEKEADALEQSSEQSDDKNHSSDDTEHSSDD